MASILPAIITGGASVLGSGVSSVGGKQAAKSQERSTAAALDFAKQQEATKQRNAEQARSDYQNYMNSRQARIDSVLRSMGVNVPEVNYGAPAAAVPQPMVQAPVRGVAGPVGGIGASVPMQGNPQNMADLMRVASWKGVGLQ